MSHVELENHMRKIIDKLQPGTVFILRDIISDPPARLGRQLYEDVQSGKIKDVVLHGKSDGVEQYKKI